jgi:Ice-binding-like/Putative Ig domain/IPTL-CTERM motif
LKIKSPGILACAGFVALLLISAPALAVDAVAPPLGTAKQFGALGHSGVTGATGTGVVVVSGDVGSSPTPTIINFPPSRTVPPYIVHYANDGVVAQAHLDAIAAYTALAGQGAGTVLDDDLTGATITPGVYSFTLGHPILPDGTTLTLNDPTGTGIFVFNVATTLTGVVNSHVVGTANPCNIYWRVGSSATLNGATFRGIVIAYASITLGSGANLAGQALATTGAVTMAGSGGNTISGCTVLPTSPCPTITIAPPTLPIGKVLVAYSQQLTASGGTGSYTFSVVSGTLPAGLTLSSDGLLAGTPTTVGSPPVTIAAIDGNGCPGVIPFVIAAETCPMITLAPPMLPTGKVGVAYSQQITASGGLAPYTFSVVGGTLPAGLTLSSGGLLSGTPTTLGSSPVTIEATDGNGCPGIILFAMAGAFAGIPTLSGWGLMTLMALIGVASIYRLRRI